MRRESYVGPWLPEPVLTDPVAPDRAAPDPAAWAEDADSLSMAFLLLLERLSPAERAVFLLRDVFDFGYPEIAGIVGITEASTTRNPFMPITRSLSSTTAKGSLGNPIFAVPTG